MTAADVKEAIHKYHGMHTGDGMWTCVNEAFSGWSSAGGGVDVMAFAAWQSAKATCLEGSGLYKTKNKWKIDTRWPTVAYEVKVSRADYKRELWGYRPGPKASYRTKAVPPWPHKAHFAIERSHYFVFAVPQGLLTDEEIARRAKPMDGKSLYLPANCGLVEVRPTGTIKVRAKAVPTAARPLTAGEVGEVIRHGLNTNKDRLNLKTLAFVSQSVKNNRKINEEQTAELRLYRDIAARVLMVKDYNNAMPYYVRSSGKRELEYEYMKQTRKHDYTPEELEEVWRRSRIKFI